MANPMMVSWLLLLILLFLVTTIGLGIVLTVGSRKTRPLGLGLLGLVAFMIVGGVSLALVATRRHAMEHTVREAHRVDVARVVEIEEAVAQQARQRPRRDESPPINPFAEPEPAAAFGSDRVTSEQIVAEMLEEHAETRAVTARPDVKMLVPVAVLGLSVLVVPFVLGLVLTIASSKTRPLGLGILGVGGVLVCLGVVVSFYFFMRPSLVTRYEPDYVDGRSDAPNVRFEAVAPTVELPAEPEAAPEALGDDPFNPVDTDAAAGKRKPRGPARAVGEALLRGFADSGADGPAEAETTAGGETAAADAVEEPEEAPAAELPLEPTSTRVVIPPGRPAWVERSPGLNEDNVYEAAVASGPYKTLSECYKALAEEVQKATDRFVERHLEGGVPPGTVSFELDDVLNNYADRGDFYHETIQSPTVGSVQQVHVLLKFDGRAEADVDRQVKHAVGTSRLMGAGLLFGGLFGVLSIVLAYLKIDVATEHRKSGRLQFGTAMAILALVAVGVLVARQIPWM